MDKTITINGKTYTIPAEVDAHITDITARHDGLKGLQDAQKNKKEVETSEADKLAFYRERKTLETTAVSLKIDSFEEMPSNVLRAAILMKYNVDVDGKTPEHLKIACDTITDALVHTDGLSNLLIETRKDGEDPKKAKSWADEVEELQKNMKR